MILIAICLIGLLYLLSKNKYNDELSNIEKKEYPLKDFFPMGFYLMDLIKYKYNSKYDRKVNLLLVEIYSIESMQFYLRVHWAMHVSSFLLALLFIGIILMGSDGSDNNVVIIMFLSVGLGFPFYDLKKRLDKKRLLMQIDFPDFLNKLTLLVGAGMTVSSAWSKIVEENSSTRPLQNEMKKVFYEVRAGKSEIEAYEGFAKRCRMPVVTKFVSVLLQNLRKGSGELIKVLDSLSDECWEMRKTAAKRMGEEASTKLLFPMMIMLAGIFIVIMTPIILEFKNM